MAGIIDSEPIPLPPAAQQYPGAYLPGLVPGAAAGQYGAPLFIPGGPVVVFGPGHYDTAPAATLEGTDVSGRADGS